MKTLKVILLLIIIPLSLSSIMAAHFIIGKVNDALNGELANDHTIVLWNPLNGINDNLTDIIGPNGNSGQNNIYMVDCELLSNSCSIGDQINIKVLDLGDSYASETTTITVTGAGYDLANDLTLNSPPNISLIYPKDQTNFSSEILFNCSSQDLDSNLANVILYGNWSNGWHANETKQITGLSNFTIFNKNITEGTYLWACSVSDNLSIKNYSYENRTFNVDKTNPEIFSISINETYICGTSSAVLINCTANDSFTGIHTVKIMAISPNSITNYTAQPTPIKDIYNTTIPITEQGEWQFICYANDTAGNLNLLESQNITTYSLSSDLTLFSQEINFSDLFPIENQEITIKAPIHNKGCQDANNFLVGFYEGDPDSGGIQIGENQTLSITQRTNETANITWIAKIGPTNIYIKIDVSGIISESNESNNKENSTINVGAWQTYYGTINSSKILGNQNLDNLSFWFNESSSTGNIYVADKESSISWGSLIALGRNLTEEPTSNDFTDIDILLGMQTYNDSLSNKFTTDGSTPKDTTNFIIQSSTIKNVPIINSTNTTNFITGILWDSSYDSDTEYSQEDNEKLVFVTKINKNKSGKYGTYDYEITIPVKIRSQDPTDSSELYFYYELI